MQKFPSVILHQNKTGAVKRFHPWVFSGAVKKKGAGIAQGDIVDVLDEKGEYLGSGHFGNGSIAVRMFSFKRFNSLEELWLEKFKNAYALREAIGIATSKVTNTYRLVNAEGDGMPGLIVDWYNGTAVVQAHSSGMHREREKFVETLKAVYGNELKAVYDKSKQEQDFREVAVENESRNLPGGNLYGTATSGVVQENRLQFKVDWEQGQKTGFFIDQRDNRLLLSRYVENKKVLNTFCYSGGFSIYALKGGAKHVDSVDSSAKAIEWTLENAALNEVQASRHAAHAQDVFEFLKNADKDYEVIVLDPPAFAKGQSARHSAIKAYTRLNFEALKKIKPGGIIFTFSCSQAVNPEMFAGAVTAAAIESGRSIKILHHLTQPADHPISIFNPEGLYLKGLVLYVE